MILDIIAHCSTSCVDVDTITILDLIRTLFKLVMIAVPIILVIFIMLDVFKTVSAGEIDTKKFSKKLVTKLLAALLVFLVGPIINLVINLLPVNTSAFVECYQCIDDYNKIEHNDENPPLPDK